jgi:hypothetical protein
MGNSLQALENQYMLLTQNLSSLLDACSTQQQKDSVMAQYVDSRRNYWNSIHKLFHDDDPAIVSLVKKMGEQQKQIESCKDKLNDIAKVIQIITSAVSVGTTLAAKAG